MSPFWAFETRSLAAANEKLCGSKPERSSYRNERMGACACDMSGSLPPRTA
jgi:hypothetical protein